MTRDYFPQLDDPDLPVTRDLAHQYSKLMGNWLKAYRTPRKHWWHASLRPSLSGLTTGVVHAAIDFEMRLDLRQSVLRIETTGGKEFYEVLRGQSATELAVSIERFLIDCGIDEAFVPQIPEADSGKKNAMNWCTNNASTMACALNSVSACMKTFRAGIREETSPVQLWPHHFDLSMLWLSGDRIADQDPSDEEHADMQMNIGFTMGDSVISQPYFYVTAYPLDGELPQLALPSGSRWHSDRFNGVVLEYRTLVTCSDPEDYLLSLWTACRSAAAVHFSNQSVLEV